MKYYENRPSKIIVNISKKAKDIELGIRIIKTLRHTKMKKMSTMQFALRKHQIYMKLNLSANR